MSRVTNTSPYAAELFSLLDAHAQEQRILVVSARYEVRPNQPAKLCDEQQPPSPVDEYWADPASSSVRVPSQVALHKQAVDVLVYGSAIALKRGVTSVSTELRIANVKKQLLVSGNRRWMGVGKLATPSSPAAFERMLIMYERAYGGSTPFCAENPVGIGGAPSREQIEMLGTEVPNVELPNERMMTALSRPKPAGYGAIAPWWAPRARLAGTYDDAWKDDQAPLLPLDFDARFFQVAPADQQARHVAPGELVQLVGMTPEGTWRFELPQLVPEVRVLRDRKGERVSLQLDTIVLEPDEYRVTLYARCVLSERRREPLREVLVGPVGRGAWRSLLTRKPFKHGLGEEA